MTTKRTILVVGDSITWGSDPTTKRRHPADKRWPNVVAAALGDRAEIITEALCGRTTAYDDFAAAEERNAARSLPMLLASHQPIDIVIFMLGTNDLKPHLAGSALGAQSGMRRLIQIVRSHPYIDSPIPDILVIAPPHRLATPNRPEALPETIAQSLLVAPLYAALAKEQATGFFDAATACTASMVDGVHLEADQTAALGVAIAKHLYSSAEVV